MNASDETAVETPATLSKLETDLAIARLIEALGGAAAVAGVSTETISATGWRHHPGWGTEPAEPEAVAEFTYTLIQDAVAPRYNLTFGARTTLVPSQLQYNEIGNGSAGHLEGSDFMFDPRPVSRAIPSWRVATRQRHFDLTSPLRLANKLAAAAADVTFDGEGLTLREVGRPAVRIVVDGSGLPVRAELMEEHPPLGDTRISVEFLDYRSVGAVVLPHQVVIRADGVVIHDEERSAIQVDADTSDEVFALADSTVRDGALAQDAFVHNSTEWILNFVIAGVAFYYDLQLAPTTPEAVQVAPGVKIVLGPSHNSLVVEMPDHVAVVEAPLYDEYTKTSLAQIRNAFPGKPLRTVIATHFHYDHIGGIREFVADGGLTVVSHASTVDFFERIFAGPHTVDPDRFQVAPVAVEVRGVSDVLALPMADGGELQVHHIVSDHADDMVIVYLSGPKVVFQSDLWNPTPSMPASGAQRGRLATQLYDAITELGLDVEHIVGGHKGTDGSSWTHIAPLAFLKTAAGL